MRVTITAILPSRVLVRSPDGREGFIVWPELSWDERESKFSWLVVGGEVVVRVLVLLDDGRFGASVRQARPNDDPWGVGSTLAVGDLLHGVVCGVAPWGANVRIDGGLYAAWVFSEGECAELGESGKFRVVLVDKNSRRLQVAKVR